MNLLLLELLGLLCVSLHRVNFLPLDDLVFLLLDEVVLRLDFLVEVGAYSWEFKGLWHISRFKSLSYLLFENHKFILHFRVYISFLIGGPKSPKSIAFNIPMFRFLLLAKNVFPKLLKDVLPL